MDDETLRRLLGQHSLSASYDALTAATEMARQDKALRDLVDGHEHSAMTAIQDALRDATLTSPTRAFEAFVNSSDYLRLSDQAAMRAAHGLALQDTAMSAIQAYRSIDQTILDQAHQAIASSEKALLERHPIGEFADHASAARNAAMSFVTREQGLEWAKMDATTRAIQAMVLPDTASLFEMATRAAQHTEIHHRLMADQEAWRGDLAWRMATISTPWAAADDLMGSGQAFGELAALADVVSFDAPFDPETDARVHDELGAPLASNAEETAEERDRRRTAAGRNPALVAFPREGFGQVILSAGFRLIVPIATAPPTEDDIDVVFDPAHNAMITHLEQHLRQLVQARLEAWGGSSWLMQCVPPTMLKAWEERREQARDKGRNLLPLIHYSDFGDLAQVITGRSNWKNVFQDIFQHKEFVVAAFLRLQPIRNDLAHSRPLRQGDVLDLMAEGSRLFRAIGVDVVR